VINPDISASTDLHDLPYIRGRTGKEVPTASLSSRNNLAVLEAFMDARAPQRTLEIGLALGASACTIADSHRRNGSAPSGQHVAIDPFQTTVWDDCGVLALEHAGLAPYCTVTQEFSSTALPGFLKDRIRFELIYIDGSHIFEDVFIDVYFAARLLSPRGVMLLDDSSDPHVSKVLRFVRTNMDAGLREVDLTPFRAKSDLKGRLKYAAGRALGRVQLTAFECVGEVERSWNASFRNF
jgi:predicted O-methyltransferase YrrM